MNKVDLDESPLKKQFESNTTFRLYLLKESVLTHFQSLFGRSKNEGKIHEGGYLKEFFSLTCGMASRNFTTI